MIINARPDVPTELQIDYCTLSKLNPQLIYCDNTAFGQIGPQAHKPGYDLIVQALSGLLVANNNIVDGLPKQTASTAIADYCTGLAIAWSICAALYTRERKGIGQKIDTTLFASALAVQSGFFQISEIFNLKRLFNPNRLPINFISSCLNNIIFVGYFQF